jgi:PAS domain S-box-containing protein
MTSKPTLEELEERVRDLEKVVEGYKRAEKKLRETEIRYHTLLDHAPVGIWHASPDGSGGYINPKLKELTGLTLESATGKGWASALHPDDRERVFKEWSDFVEGKAAYHSTYRFLDADNKARWVIGQAMPVHSVEGELLGHIGTLTDITERQEREQTLKEKEAELGIKAKNLQEVNTALRVLLKQRERDKAELEEKVLSNVKNLILSYLEKLKKTSLDSNQKFFVDILESNLNDIISPFSRKLSSKYLGLTPTEIRVANLIKDDKTTKEIAEIMNVSERTVDTHRDRIRKKIGIKHKKVNLRTYLSSLQ